MDTNNQTTDIGYMLYKIRHYIYIRFAYLHLNLQIRINYETENIFSICNILIQMLKLNLCIYIYFFLKPCLTNSLSPFAALAEIQELIRMLGNLIKMDHAGMIDKTYKTVHLLSFLIKLPEYV
jgi:hypothetical protein